MENRDKAFQDASVEIIKDATVSEPTKAILGFGTRGLSMALGQFWIFAPTIAGVTALWDRLDVGQSINLERVVEVAVIERCAIDGERKPC